jgi:ribonuclease VapC
VVVDTSALIAMLLAEPPADRLIDVFETGAAARMSAASLVEGGIVMQRRQGDEGEVRFDRLVHRLDLEIVPVTREHAEIARAAYRRFGKGRHPAGLNFGDCFSYALARSLDEPLLFVGDDFSQTDIVVALY